MYEQSDTAPVQFGNADQDAKARGWFVGKFIAEVTGGLRHSEDVEVKWGTHAAGEERSEWALGNHQTTIALLISGKWEMIFRDQTVMLSKPGDYVMWGKGIDHRGQAPEDAVVITIRWPSISED